MKTNKTSKKIYDSVKASNGLAHTGTVSLDTRYAISTIKRHLKRLVSIQVLSSEALDCKTTYYVIAPLQMDA